MGVHARVYVSVCVCVVAYFLDMTLQYECNVMTGDLLLKWPYLQLSSLFVC